MNGELNAFTCWVPGRIFIQLNAEIVGADRIVLSVKAKEAYDNLELNISAPGMTVRGFALEETSGAAARRLDLTQDYRELFQGIEKRKKRR